MCYWPLALRGNSSDWGFTEGFLVLQDKRQTQSPVPGHPPPSVSQALDWVLWALLRAGGAVTWRWPSALMMQCDGNPNGLRMPKQAGRAGKAPREWSLS